MQLNYNPAEVPADERADFALMPAGAYTFVVNSSEEKPGKREGAKRLIFTVTCTGPTHRGQKLWPDFNITNPSEAAQRIARQELNKFSDACGVPHASLRDSGQLHNKAFTGQVIVHQATGYSDRNEIKSFAPAGGTRPAAAPPRAAFTPPDQASLPVDGEAPAAPAPPPWAVKAA